MNKPLLDGECDSDNGVPSSIRFSVNDTHANVENSTKLPIAPNVVGGVTQLNRLHALHMVLHPVNPSLFKRLQQAAPLVAVWVPFLYVLISQLLPFEVQISGCRYGVDYSSATPIGLDACVGHNDEETHILVPGTYLTEIANAVNIFFVTNFTLSLAIGMGKRARRYLPYGIYISSARRHSVLWFSLLVFSLIIWSITHRIQQARNIREREREPLACDDNGCWYMQTEGGSTFGSVLSFFWELLNQLLQYSAVLVFAYNRLSNPYVSVTIRQLFNTPGHRDGRVADELSAVRWKVRSSSLGLVTKEVLRELYPAEENAWSKAYAWCCKNTLCLCVGCCLYKCPELKGELQVQTSMAMLKKEKHLSREDTELIIQRLVDRQLLQRLDFESAAWRDVGMTDGEDT